MDFSSRKIVEIVGFLAVIASLLFVAYEIRQSNRIALGTTAYEIQRNWISINDAIATDEELAALLIKLGDENAELSALEQVQSAAYGRRFINTWIAVQEAYDNGLVSDAVYQIAIDDVRNVLSRRPKLKDSFKNFASSYDVSEYKILAPIHEL